jgi:hypothetical protein
MGKVVGQFGSRQQNRLPYSCFIMVIKQAQIAGCANSVIVIIALELRNIKSIHSMLAVLGKQKCQRKEVSYARTRIKTLC